LESDSDEESDEEGLEHDGMPSNKFTRHSSGGYELVGGAGGQSETASSEGGSYFPSSNSINEGFKKSKATFVEVPFICLPPPSSSSLIYFLSVDCS
jgi:hypothetical protein